MDNGFGLIVIFIQAANDFVKRAFSRKKVFGARVPYYLPALLAENVYLADIIALFFLFIS